MAEVVITKDRLEEARACRVYLDSPEWDKEREALVYTDWDATVRRLMSAREGMAYLDFLVARELVPMTKDTFQAMRSALRTARLEHMRAGGR